MLVAELKEEVESFAIAGLGFNVPPLVLGDHTEIVVNASRAVLVAELKEEVQGFAIADLGFSEPPLASGHRPSSW